MRLQFKKKKKRKGNMLLVSLAILALSKKKKRLSLYWRCVCPLVPTGEKSVGAYKSFLFSLEGVPVMHNMLDIQLRG